MLKLKMTPKEAELYEDRVRRWAKDPRFAIEDLCFITNKLGRKVQFDLWQPQVKALKYITEAINTPDKTEVLFPKFRQGGVSKLCSANAVIRARLFKNQNALFLIKSDEDTQPFFDDKIKEVDENLPIEFYCNKTRDQSTSIKYEDTNSTIRIATAGATMGVTEKKGRSGRENYVHVTEAAYITYLQSLENGVRGALPPNGTIVYESTMNGPRNYFYTKCIKIMQDGDELEKNVWRLGNRWLIFLPFYEHPEYKKPKPDKFEFEDKFEAEAWEIIHAEGGCDEAAYWYIMEYREKKNAKSSGMDENIDTDAETFMRREYPITLMDGFMDTGSNYFDVGIISAIKKYVDTLKRKTYQFGIIRVPGGEIQLVEPDKYNRIYVWAPPQPGWTNRYMVCGDCGEGNYDSDLDVIYVFDRVEREVCAKAVGRLGGERQAGLMMAVGEWYNNAWLSWDRTGIGADRLPYFMAARYPNIYSSREVEDVFLEPAWLGVKWNIENKHTACSLLRTAWEQWSWKIYDPAAYEEANYFGYPEDSRGKKLPEAAHGFTDDHIMALAVIAYCESTLPPPIMEKTVKPFIPVNKVQEIYKKATTKHKTVPSAFSGMGNY